MKEEINSVANNIEKYNLKSFLGKKKWFDSILKMDERNKKHPIFWLLTEEKASFKLYNQLDILKTKCKNYDSIIKKLGNEYESTMAEIEVISYFCENINSSLIEYEPKFKNFDRKPDLKISYQKQNYFIEISLLDDDNESQKLENLSNNIRKRLREQNKVYNFIFEINPILENAFENEENINEFIDGFISFISEKNANPSSYIYNKNGFHCDITILKEPWGPVEYSGLRAPNMPRIKNKLLTKIQREQLPNDEYNIIIIKLKDNFSTYSAFKEAIYGQDNLNKKEINKSLGLIDNPQSNNISAFIAFKRDFVDGKVYSNPNANKPIIGLHKKFNLNIHQDIN